jgi:hypothetical protein
VIIETLLEGVRKGPSLLFRKECFDNTRIFDYQNSKSLHPPDHFTRRITSPAGSLHPLDHFTRWITSPAGSLHPLDHFTRWITSPAGSLHPLDHFTRWITSPAGSLHPLDHFTRWITSPAGSLHPLDHPQSQAEPTIIGFYTSIPAIPAIPAIQAITTQARSAAFSKAHTMPLRRGVLGTSPALMPRRNSRIAARHACFSAGMATMA